MDVELISTARLDLVPLSVEHAEEMATVLSSPTLHTFIGGEPPTPDALRIRYERLVAGPSVPSVAEIAWVVGTPWQGQGVASEAARGLVSWLGRKPSVHQVVAHIHPDHGASAAVATAAGLTPTEQSHGDEIRWQRATRP
ncbi:GNAT family N-acetyltransferase [Streptomyces galilaeus]